MDNGHKRCLAWDRSNFSEMTGAQIHVLPAHKRPENPVLIPDTPWEEDVHIYGTVLKADGIYRMWYFARAENYAVRSVCYATSKDGVHWEKPELDVARYQGCRTNIVFGTPVMGEGFEENGTVLYTPWDRGREYKMLYVARYKQHAEAIRTQSAAYYRGFETQYLRANDQLLAKKCRQRAERMKDTAPAVYIATSQDGIHWCEADRPVSPLINDISHMMYDPYTAQYRLYGRGFMFDEGRCATDKHLPLFDGYLGRAIFLTTSSDAVHWSDAKPIYSADASDRPGDEIYSMAVFPWAGRYLGLTQMYHGAPDDMTLDVQLSISCDGERFERVGDRNPIIPLGEIGEWDRFNTAIADLPVLEETGKIRTYFNGNTFRHLQIAGSGEYSGLDTGARLARIGLAEIDMDRFACVMASFQGANLTTFPFRLTGDTLYLNAEARWGTLAVCFDDGERTETVHVTESGMDLNIPIPGWARGREVSLHFNLKNARLYSFWF